MRRLTISDDRTASSMVAPPRSASASVHRSPGTGSRPRPYVQLKPGTIENLRNHDYPGNVRELRNLIERAVIMAQMGDDSAIDPLPMPMPMPQAPAGAPSDDVLQTAVDVEIPYKQAKGLMVGEFDKRYLKKLLKKFDGNVSKAARAAGLDRMTVHKMLNRRGVVNVRRSSS